MQPHDLYVLPSPLFFPYPLKRQYDDRDVFADITSVDQVHFVVLNSATSAVQTTSTSDAREIRRTSRVVNTTLFDRTNGFSKGCRQSLIYVL
jgi:hypothetical protein